MKFVDRCAAFERQFLSRSDEQQTEIVAIARALIKSLGPGGGVETEDLFGILDIVQNVSGKLQQPNADPAALLAEVHAGMPTVAGRVLDGLV